MRLFKVDSMDGDRMVMEDAETGERLVARVVRDDSGRTIKDLFSQGQREFRFDLTQDWVTGWAVPEPEGPGQ